MSINDWNINQNWTLFLDRDGVINKRIFGGYITKIEEFKFLSTPKTIAKLTSFFQRTIIVTNQQGIGKGIMSERNLSDIHDYMSRSVEADGGKIDYCYFAPNLRGAEEDSRKPNKSMGLKAKSDFPEIEFNQSIMVGDTDSDIQFGKNLGMKTVRIQTEEQIAVSADITVNSLNDLLKLVNNAINS